MGDDVEYYECPTCCYATTNYERFIRHGITHTLSQNEKKPTKNSKVLESFVNYCEAHPEERFWQALRNWSGYSFVGVWDNYFDKYPIVLDKFSWEHRRHDTEK
jgi:hypothetical protein